MPTSAANAENEETEQELLESEDDAKSQDKLLGELSCIILLV